MSTNIVSACTSRQSVLLFHFLCFRCWSNSVNLVEGRKYKETMSYSSVKALSHLITLHETLGNWLSVAA